MKRILLIFLVLSSFIGLAQETKTQLTTRFDVVRNAGTGQNTAARIANAYQELSDGSIGVYPVTLTGTGTYTGSLIGLDGYTGRIVFVTFSSTNAGSATANLNSIGATAIQKDVSGTWTNLSASDLLAGKLYRLYHDGTRWQIDLSSSGGGSQSLQDVITVSSALTNPTAITSSDSVSIIINGGSGNVAKLQVDGVNGESYLIQSSTTNSSIHDTYHNFAVLKSADLTNTYGDIEFKASTDTENKGSIVSTNFGNTESSRLEVTPLISRIISGTAGTSKVELTKTTLEIAPNGVNGDAFHVLGSGGQYATWQALTADHLSTLTTSRTLTTTGDTDQTDNLRIIYTNSGSPFNLQVDLLTAGTRIDVINLGAGTVTLTQGAGITLSPSTIPLTTGQTATIIYRVAATPEVYTQASAGGSGSVTTVSVVSANGLAGSVANPTTTPAITLSTSINGVLKGNGTAISSATNADLPAMTATVGGAVPTPPNNTTTFLRGDGTFAAPAGGGDALTSNPLSQFAATTSAQLRGVLSDESGTGNAYFQGGDIGTPSAGVGTNLTGIPYTALTGTSPFWNATGTTTITGSSATITSTAPEQVLHTASYTATANNQAAERFSASPTSRNTASDVVYAYLFDGTLTRHASNPATQRAVYLGVRPTFANAFAKTEALNVLGNVGLGTPLTNTNATIIFHTSSNENLLTSAADAIGVSTSAGGTPLIGLTSSELRIVSTGGIKMTSNTTFLATNNSRVIFRVDEDNTNTQGLIRFFNAPKAGTTTANQYFAIGNAATAPTTGATDASFFYSRDNTAGNGTASLAILSENSIPNIIGSQAGFGTLTPNSNLSVIGSFSAGYVAKTANYTADISDYTINCTANTFQVTLPTAVGIPGRIYNIVNSGAGTITVGTTSSQTFTNVTATPTTLTMATVGTVTVQSDGANWMKLSGI